MGVKVSLFKKVTVIVTLVRKTLLKRSKDVTCFKKHVIFPNLDYNEIWSSFVRTLDVVKF